VDSGIRLTVSKITELLYNSPTVKHFYSTNALAASNTLPQIAQTVVTYVGDLGTAKWVALVDSTLNSFNPCTQGSVVTTSADYSHSGVIQAAAGTKYITMQQSTLLSKSKTYAVCYADIDAGISDSTWRDSYIRFTISKVFSLSCSGVPIIVQGSIGHHPALECTFAGSLDTNQWLALVDQTLNGNFPCADGSVAAASGDSMHSGAIQGATAVVELNTTVLNTSKVFAACYSEGDGSTTASWIDSGIRIMVSKVFNLDYFSPTKLTTSMFQATDVLPQVENVTITYVGDLGIEKWISLVDATLNYGYPCVNGSVAAGVADSTHSGPIQATTGTKAVIIPQDILLSENITYAVCYAVSSGAQSDLIWQYSGLRYLVSKLKSVSAHGVTHSTAGNIARTATLELVYDGPAAVYSWFTLVDSTLNGGYPCSTAGLSMKSMDESHSGLLRSFGAKSIAVDTTFLSSTASFAFCYSEAAAVMSYNGRWVHTGVLSPYAALGYTKWVDSGVRLTIANVKHLIFSENDVYGVPNRYLRSTNVMAATNRLPQAANVIVTYVGTLAAAKWLSLVDSTLNGGNPCVNVSVAAAGEDSTHSGATQAASGTKEVAIPQSTLLSEAKTFAVCYAEASDTSWMDNYWSTTDSSWKNSYRSAYWSSTGDTWSDSYVRVKASKVASVSAVSITHKTVGQIPSAESLQVTYSGALPANQWLSFVDDTVNAQFPCANGSHAAHAASSMYSGLLQASGNMVTLNSSILPPSAVYAVCYSEGGSQSDAWLDSGIRLRTPKIVALTYSWPGSAYAAPPGPASSPVREWNSIRLATNVLPQVLYTTVIYHGSMESGKRISLVDETLNSYSACILPAIAGAVGDSTHSGMFKAPFESTEVAIQQFTLLDEDKVYAVCYADADGSSSDSTWRDSYIRVTISKIESLSSHTITHWTNGQIARVGGTKVVWNGTSFVSTSTDTLAECGTRRASRGGCIADLQLTFSGSLGADKYVSLVDATLNGDFPCANGSIAAAGYDSLHSGAAQATDSVVIFDTLLLDSSKTFAACYTEGDGTSSAAWVDSGIRLTVSKITEVLYGTFSSSLPQRTFRSTNVMAPTNRLPQVANATFTYVGDLGTAKWVSLIDSTLNGGNPCVKGAVAAAGDDSLHSGAVQAAIGTKEVTIPQSTLLDETKTFAICYAEYDGSTTDSTWSDSYIRIMVSQIESIVSSSVTHDTDGNIGSSRTLQLEYTGSFAPNQWIALLDDTFNSFEPCGSALLAITPLEGVSTGRLQALGRFITADSTQFASDIVLAVCYSAHGDLSSTWLDSGIRLTTPMVLQVLYGHTHTIPLRMSNYLTRATDVFPQAEDRQFSYTGALPAGKWFSLVDLTINNNNPCVIGAEAAHSADHLHSGTIQANSSNKMVTVPQFNTASLLNETKKFAICYAEANGLASDSTWRDSYIRYAISKVEYLHTSKVLYTNEGSLGRLTSMKIKYVGTLAAYKWLSLVDDTLNSDFPCANATIAAGTADTLHSGAAQGLALPVTYDSMGVESVVTFNTLGLNATKTFAACYSEGDGTASFGWVDTGIRFNMSKVVDVSYGVPARLIGTSSQEVHIAPATNRLPSMSNVVLRYAGELVDYKWLSLIHADINQGNPCAGGLYAAAPADAYHTGAHKAQSCTGESHQCSRAGTEVVFTNIDQLDVSVTYAVCYTAGDGSTLDRGWEEAGIRIELSKIESLQAHAVKHVTNGQIARVGGSKIIWDGSRHVTTEVADLKLTLTGSLGGDKWVSLVDETFNANYPCANSTIAAAGYDSLHSGAAQASSSVVAFDTKGMSTTQTFAACYTEGDGTSSAAWFDSGIRLTVSKMTEIHYGTSSLSFPQRTFRSTNVMAATNRLPQVANTTFTYVGDLGSAKWVSLIDSTLNGGNPCVMRAWQQQWQTMHTRVQSGLHQARRKSLSHRIHY
jgi:hypothetical protein